MPANASGRLAIVTPRSSHAELLVYRGGWLDDLKWLRRRQIRRLFGWVAVPDPTTFGRWLRRCGAALTPILDELVWHLVRIRSQWTRVPRAVAVAVDSTVILRYGLKQAGAEVGYNPKKPGRPSHHPLVAFLQETGDLVGLKWRPGSANTATGAVEWIVEFAERIWEAGVQEVTLQADKGFSRSGCPVDWTGLGSLLPQGTQPPLAPGPSGTLAAERSGRGTFSGAEKVYSATGEVEGFRLRALQGRRPMTEDGPTLKLGTYEITDTAHTLMNVAGHPLPHRLAVLQCRSCGRAAD